MDERVEQAVKEFIKRLKAKFPEVEPIIEDFKWSTEDIYIDVRAPRKKRDRISDAITPLMWDIYRETGVYVLALVHSSDSTKTAAKKG